MKVSIRYAVLATIWLGAWSCQSGDDTAIVIEVMPGALDPTTLDEVLFRVMGPGIEAGERVARAPLRGSEAKTFPLSLAIRGTAPGAGPFMVDVEARTAGALRATASDGIPLAFENGKVVRRLLVLRAVNGEVVTAPDAGGSSMTDASAVPVVVPPARDASAAGADTVRADARAAVPADAGIDETRGGGGGSPNGNGGDTGGNGGNGAGGSMGGGAGGRPGEGTGGNNGAAGNGNPPSDGNGNGMPSNPPGGNGSGGMPQSGPGDSGVGAGTAGAGGGSCDGCDKMCTTSSGNLCSPAPDGTPCHGNSGMTCTGCQCIK
jgi:hypothetical protein